MSSVSLNKLFHSDFIALFQAHKSSFDFLPPRASLHHHYFCTMHHQTLLGFAQIEDNPEYNNFYVSYLTVTPPMQGQGLSKNLLKKIFDDATDRKKAILFSPFTQMGKARILKNVIELQKTYPMIEVAYEQYA